MSDFIIETGDVTKTYYTGKATVEVLRGVSIQVPRSKISVIIGASGAGKSTLLHILGGLDRPDNGTVAVNGHDLRKMNEKELSKFRSKEIGFVFQFHHLLPEFTALENTAIPLMIGGLSKKHALAKAKDMLSLVGLDLRMEHKPAELSGGEQQRVAIARALANDPAIIFADEPTGNLDSVNSDSVHHLFLELRDSLQKTFVIVTHNSGMMQLADTIFSMKDGVIENK
jgi:lipoprotein-releasing system ATP-binding protein